MIAIQLDKPVDNNCQGHDPVRGSGCTCGRGGCGGSKARQRHTPRGASKADQSPIPDRVLNDLKRQGYKIVGGHSGVKLCHWTKSSVMSATEKHCYKQQFYGINSHQCIQMTPAVAWCQQKCLFCWRGHEFGVPAGGWDDPADIVRGSIAAQRELLMGYKGLPDRVNMDVLREAMHPRHVAISLTGEPTMYPHLGDMIDEWHKQGVSTFQVTNGLLPEVLEDEVLPTQLYVSLTAPNKKIHEELDIPQMPNAWERFQKTFDILPSLDTRRVIRVTMVKGWNDVQPEKYAEMISRAEADFVEVKGYMFVGESRNRMSIANMPSHDEVRAWALRIAEHLPGYELVDEKRDSRVVLLTNHAKPQRLKFRD
jgi:tRNA wybutosine-synthesizing protein 1